MRMNNKHLKTEFFFNKEQSPTQSLAQILGDVLKEGE
jgi:hypothetical protein